MNRRNFLSAVAVSPLMAVPVSEALAAVSKTGGVRISCLRDDPGYRAYCLASGDGKKVQCFLNGIEQRGAVTADESLGMIYRLVMTEKGNAAHANGEILHEAVYGDVRIVIV